MVMDIGLYKSDFEFLPARRLRGEFADAAGCRTDINERSACS
ncbi:MAG: hypothetical protein OXU61_10455 [Gammaproteobacteria bacterium]|nr:hypothetical protein [Gammaproteobacteria bacterium]